MKTADRDSDYRARLQGLQVGLCALLRAKGPLNTVDICTTMDIPVLTLSKMLRGSRSFLVANTPKTPKGVSRVVSLHIDLLRPSV